MRAIAATCVLVYHAWAVSTPSGPVAVPGLRHVLPDLAFGVTLFFALSGFLLYRPFAAALVRGRRLPSTRSYLRNRALRILPAYWVILLLSSAVLQTTLVRSGEHLAPGRLSGGVLASASAFVQNYRPESLGSGIGPAWSLAVEAVFYVVLPGLALGALLLARRACSRRGRLGAALVPPMLLLVLGMSGKLAAAVLVPGPFGAWSSTWHSVIELSFWAQADLFAFGMGLAVLHVQAEDGRLRLPAPWRRFAGAGALAAYLGAAAATDVEEQLSASPANTVMAVGTALLLALVLLPDALRERPPALLRALEWRPVVYLGTVSYSVFLWHGPLVRALREHGWTLDGAGGLVVNTLVLLAVTLALSTLSYRLVELPALRRKARRAPGGDAVPVAQVSAAP